MKSKSEKVTRVTGSGELALPIHGLANGCRETPIAFLIEKDLKFDEWLAVTRGMIRVHGYVNWWVGDLLVWGEGKFGDEYAQAIEPLEIVSAETAKQCQWISERVPIIRRDPEIAWTIYRMIAKLNEKEQVIWLKHVKDENLSTRQLKERFEKPKREAALAENSPPVQALSIVSAFATAMKQKAAILAPRKWHPDSLATLRAAWDSMKVEIETLYEWV